MAARGQKGDNSSLCLTLKLHQSGRKKPASIFVFTFDALLQLSRLGCDGPDAITDMPPHTHTHSSILIVIPFFSDWDADQCQNVENQAPIFG